MLPPGINFSFRWNPNKARENECKHGVTFWQGREVFRDPLAMSVFDKEHSADEDRWITLGQTGAGKMLIVVHTYQEIGEQRVLIDIISVRPATRTERRQYEEGK